MSFSLLTAINPEDVPGILRRCARNYRGNVSAYPETWKKISFVLESLAADLEPNIPAWKSEEPAPRRPRIKL